MTFFFASSKLTSNFNAQNRNRSESAPVDVNFENKS